jgi:hypothetical protein
MAHNMKKLKTSGLKFSNGQMWVEDSEL